MTDIPESETSNPYELLAQNPIKWLGIYTVLVGAGIAGTVFISKGVASDDAQEITSKSVQQTLVQRCIGEDDGKVFYEPNAHILLKDFAQTNGWIYNPDTNVIFHSADAGVNSYKPVSMDLINSRSKNYECVVRRIDRVQHR